MAAPVSFAKDQPEGFVNRIKNVVIVGAAGQIGQHITAALLKTGQHNVTAITRPESTNTIPDGVNVVKASYDDHTALVNAMRGQDVLIITMNVLATADSSTKLIEAGIEAGVPYILPNEWGSDYTDAEFNKDVGLGDARLAGRRLIESKGQNRTSWIALVCGFWYDYSLAAETFTFGFDFERKTVTLYDDGTYKMRQSTLPYVGQAVGKLLSLPILPFDENDKGPYLEEYKNGFCRVSAFHLDQRDMLASVLRVTGDKESDWTVNHTEPAVRFSEGRQMLQQGNRRGFQIMLYSRSFYPSNPVLKPEDYSDARLGLQPPNLDDVTRWAIGEARRLKSGN